MWNFYNELLEVSRKDAKDAKVNVLGTEKIWRGLGLGRRAGIASRHCEQALRADMGRHSVLRTSYLRRVCRSYGAVF